MTDAATGQDGLPADPPGLPDDPAGPPADPPGLPDDPAGPPADPPGLPDDPLNPKLSLLHRPTVRVISDPKGMPLAKPLTVDLSRADPATGQIRKIIKTTDPQRYGIRVSDYLLA